MRKPLSFNLYFTFSLNKIYTIYLHTSSANSVVEAEPPKSTVNLLPSRNTFSKAVSIFCAFSYSPKYLSIITDDWISAVGLALFWPAICGALPWTASNIAQSLPIFALGIIPKPPTSPAPKSDSILPSITRRSLMYVAEHYLGMEVEHRPVHKDELKDFAEIGLCGTAAVISPVGQIDTPEGTINVPAGMDDMGPITKKLYDTLLGIQHGEIEAPEGWIVEIC